MFMRRKAGKMSKITENGAVTFSSISTVVHFDTLFGFSQITHTNLTKSISLEKGPTSND